MYYVIWRQYMDGPVEYMQDSHDSWTDNPEKAERLSMAKARQETEKLRDWFSNCQGMFISFESMEQ